MLRFAIITLFLCLLYPALAQKNFQQGYIVKTQGDTLHGVINYSNWEKNPSKIEFSSSSTDRSSVYRVNDIMYFEITNRDAYQKAIIKKDISPIKITDFDETPTTAVVIDTVFLRVLTKGEKLNLYELVDKKPHYFIQTPPGEYNELIYRVVADKANPGQYYNQYTFRNQLKAFANNNDELLNKINKARYVSKDIAFIVMQINTDNAFTASEIYVKNSSIDFIVGTGLLYNTLNFSGSNQELNKLNFKPVASVSIFAGLDIFTTRNLKNLALRFEVSYNSTKYSGEATDKDYYGNEEKKEYIIRQNNFTPEIGILYNFLRFPKCRLYAGAGIALNFTSYSDNAFTTTKLETNEVSTEENYLALEKFWAAPQVYVGCVINNKIDAALGLKTSGTFANFSGINAKNNLFTFKVRYHF